MSAVIELLVGEPWDFEANDGPNRLLVEDAGLATGLDLPDWQRRYLLLRVLSPFELKGERVEWLVATPRYEGVTLEHLRTNGGTAGIARIRPGVGVDPARSFGPLDVEYFMIADLRALASGHDGGGTTDS